MQAVTTIGLDIAKSVFQVHGVGIHKEVFDFERIEAISEPMRELIEDL